MNTKEKILMTALRLFARNGCEAVSVGDIAADLNMAKSALYKHYKNKRAVFDGIVAKMFEIDAERARLSGVPEQKRADDPAAYAKTTFENLKRFTIAQFEFWTRDEFARDFRKMLTLEQYRDPESAKLLRDCLTRGPVLYTADIFREMMDAGTLTRADPEQLALEYCAPLCLLIALSDGGDPDSRAERMLERHIDRFAVFNAPKREKGV